VRFVSNHCIKAGPEWVQSEDKSIAVIMERIDGDRETVIVVKRAVSLQVGSPNLKRFAVQKFDAYVKVSLIIHNVD